MVTVGVVVAAMIMPFGVLRSRADGLLDGYCESDCSLIDRVAALVTLRSIQGESQMSVDPCQPMVSTRIERKLRLPRVDSEECARPFVLVAVNQKLVSVDGLNVMDTPKHVVDGQWIQDGLFIPLREVLIEKAEDARAIGARNPNQPFGGNIMLAIDVAIPMDVVDAIRVTADSAGFHEHQALVAIPGKQDPIWLRLVPLNGIPIEARSVTEGVYDGQSFGAVLTAQAGAGAAESPTTDGLP